MRYANEELGVSLEVPDRITVRQQLQYDGARMSLHERDTIIRLWEAAKAIITEWECPYLPLTADLDKIEMGTADSGKVVRVIRWVGLVVWAHMEKINGVPKNS